MIDLCAGDVDRCNEWVFVQRLRARSDTDCAGPLVRLLLPCQIRHAIILMLDVPPVVPTTAPTAVDLCARHWLSVAVRLSRAGNVHPACWLSDAVCQLAGWDLRELDNLLRGVRYSDDYRQ